MHVTKGDIDKETFFFILFPFFREVQVTLDSTFQENIVQNILIKFFAESTGMAKLFPQLFRIGEQKLLFETMLSKLKLSKKSRQEISLVHTSEKSEEDVGMNEVDEEVESEVEKIENIVATTTRATLKTKIIATPTVAPLAITPTPVAAAVVAAAVSSSTVVVPTVSFLASTDFTGAIAGYTFKNVSLSMTFFVLFGVI